MIVAYVLVIIVHVQIVQEHQMVQLMKMNAELVMITAPMTVCQTVQVSGVEHL